MPRSRPRLVALFVVAALVAGPLTAAEPQVADAIRQSMQDRDYPQAAKAIDEAIRAAKRCQEPFPGKDLSTPRGAGSEKVPDSFSVDYLAYLKGWALCLARQFDQAVAAFEQFEKEHPKSPWIRRARFAKAVALARKGDFRSAELIYRAEAGALLSAERKQTLSDIYLGFADAYFRPPKPETKPDCSLALEFYQKALEIGVHPEKRAAVELRLAECHERTGKTEEAIKLYTIFSQQHAKDPLDVEARFRLGECAMIPTAPAIDKGRPAVAALSVPGGGPPARVWRARSAHSRARSSTGSGAWGASRPRLIEPLIRKASLKFSSE